jgi:hypothetical protein
VSSRFVAVTLVFFAVSGNLSAQIDSVHTKHQLYGLKGGLGVSMVRAADIVEYINLSFSPDSRVNDFGASPEFFVACNAQISRSYGIEAEYAYLLHSYNVTQSGFNLSLSYAVHMPVLLVYYLYTGNGYILKLGGGAGYHVAIITQNILGSVTEYSAEGIGWKIAAEGNTAFDDHLFGSIGAEMRADYLGELKGTTADIQIVRTNGKKVRMNFIGFGLLFGLAYYF